MSAIAGLLDLSRRTSKKAVAVHEAGHLFVNLHFQPSPWIGGVWIKRDGRGRWHGCVEYIHRYQWARGGSMDDARRELLVTLAGPIAEIRWRLRSQWGPMFNAEGNAQVCFGMEHEPGSDFDYARRFVQLLGGDPRETFKAAWCEADELVGRYWRSIVSVGSLLKERERMTDRELYALPEVADLSPAMSGAAMIEWRLAQIGRAA